MKEKIKKLLKSTGFNIFLIVLFTCIVLYVSLSKGGDEIIPILKNTSIIGLIGIICLMIIDKMLLGYGLMLECKQSHPKYTWWQGFVNAYVAGLFNNITPGASGGQVAQGYIFKKQGIPVSHSIGILWLDFIVYQSTMTIYVLILLILRFNYFYSNYSEFFLVVLLGFAVSSGIIVFLWLLAKSPRFYNWLTTTGINIGVKLHLIKDREKTIENLNQQLEAFSHEIVVLTLHKKMIVSLVIITVIRLTIYYSIPFFCAKALHIEVASSQLLNIIALSAFVSMINAFLPMPGSSGGTEAVFVLMFSTIFDVVDAASIMILWRSVTFYLTLIIGTVVFLYAKTRPDIEGDTSIPRTYETEVLIEEGIEK